MFYFIFFCRNDAKPFEQNGITQYCLVTLIFLKKLMFNFLFKKNILQTIKIIYIFYCYGVINNLMYGLVKLFVKNFVVSNKSKSNWLKGSRCLQKNKKQSGLLLQN